MNRARVLVVAAGAMLLAGCAATGDRTEQKEAVVAAKPAKSKLCREEAPIDSMIKRTRCVSEEQFEKERDAANRSMESNSEMSNSARR